MHELLTFLVNITRPFLKPILTMASPWSHKKISGMDYYKIKSLLQEGDVILSKTYGNFSNVLNPSELKHGAIFIGQEPIEYVVEATGDGVVKTDLVSHIMTKDEIVVTRLKLFKDDNIQFAKDAACFANSQIGKEYDYNFSSGNNKYYCFELVADSINKLERGIELKQFKKVGTLYYLSDTFLDPELFDIIYDSRRK